MIGDILCSRFSDFGEPSNQSLPPFAGYEHEPLVSLEDAVKPLINIVPHVQQNAEKVKKKCQKPADGLASDESASIMLYTFESKPQEDSLYFILNNTLRSKVRDQLKPWFLYLRLLFNALEKLPTEPRVVYREIAENLQGNYRPGEKFIWW